ncbi:hypothetical protein IIV30_029R [Invertebrate iridescent virus 30]|uniref:Uncharacterized protein n=1 Tax=Invertebrate iridescent virus 30 TaxID=345585 RepID=W8W2W0_9VIRU|nr:hypothetical protein IIV30_029R [Invertebrate iridescent virus 30]CCV02224.1 hypothetical protein IIV30_029R [Invertebrate iridescent virus 30]
MAISNQNNYYTRKTSTVPFTPFGTTTTVPFGTTTTVPFGTTTTVPFGTTTTVPKGTWFKPTSQKPFEPTSQKPFGFSNLEAKAPLFASSKLFGSSNLEAKAPLFASSNLEAKAPLFGSSNLEAKAPLFGSSNLEAKAPLFGSSNLEDLYNVASNLTLEPLNLPKNKIEGLIFMVCLDQQNTLLKTKYLLENVFNSDVKFSIDNLWLTSLIKYSDNKFALQKVEEKQILLAKLYSSLLRELMVETIQTPDQLYSYLLNFAKSSKSKKMLWLFTILKYAKPNEFTDLLDMTNEIEVFALALHSFIVEDNNPLKAMEKATTSPHVLYKTFLLSMVGASYGKEFFQFTNKNELLSEIVSKLQ